jgi:hypothetical protein
MDIKPLLLNNKFAFGFMVLLISSVVAMQYLNAPLVNDVCTGGIITYELAKELPISTAILDSWDQTTKIMAAIGLGFDYLFLIIYSSFISLLIFKVNEKIWINTTIYKVGQILIYLTYTAAFFDMVENFALIKLLQGNLDQIWSSTAYYFAMPKFGLLLISISFIMISWITILFKNLNFLK